MAEKAPTLIGHVKHVLGSTVTVSLDSDLAGVSPIYQGRLHRVGQIGSLVRIPQGLVDLIATVSLLGISELAGPLEPAGTIAGDERWLQIELLGEIDHGTGHFQRGVGSYPELDDPVHFATPDQLKAVFPPPDEEHVQLGCLAASPDVPVSLDADRLVVRHSAIVGSTGSGKTSAVASILQGFVSGGWRAANIIVVDPHGEYPAAMKDSASVRSVLAKGDHKLRVPYWALPASEILRIFVGNVSSRSFVTRFTDLVAAKKRLFVGACQWLDMDQTAVTADTPVPFDLRAVWYQMDCENREIREVKKDPSTVCLVKLGDPASLVSAEFEPYGPGGHPPHRAETYGTYGNIPDLLRLGLRDPQLQFLQEPSPKLDGSDPLVEVTQEWLGGRLPVSVLDFSGVPSRAADAAIGVVLGLVFEVAVRCETDEDGIGRPRPVLVVLEEAHRYLSDQAGPITGASANRIAREGRKYGIGLMLVSQRPTELPQTALAQCGTIVALRLSNSGDQGAIRNALPDAVSGLASTLPSLRTHEAVVSGDAVVLPARLLVDKPQPWPKAEDPSLESWRKTPDLPQVEEAIAAWRETYK